MNNRLDTANLGEKDAALVTRALSLMPATGIAKAIVLTPSTEAREAGLLSCLDAPEKRLEGKINPDGRRR